MRLLRALHAWAGLLLALLVATVALSGALLVFKGDYLRAVFPAARQVPATDAAALGAVVDRVEQQFGDEARSVVFGTARMGLHQVHLVDGGGAYVDRAGNLVDRWSPRARPEIWLFDLHQKLLAGETGHVVGGVAGLLVAVMTITGLVVWWPGGVRSFRGRLWPGSTKRPALLAHHRDLGLVAALPLLLSSLTGAALVFSDEAKAVLSFLLPQDEVATTAATAASAAAIPTAVANGEGWAAVLARAQGRFPDATLRIVAFPREEPGIATVRLKQPAEWHPNGRTRVTLALASATVVSAHDATREPLSARVYNASYPLHAARIGGRAYEVLVAGAGLALVLLSLVGAYSFGALQVRRTRRRLEETAAARLAAATPARND